MINWGAVVGKIRESHKRDGLSLVSPHGVFAFPEGSVFVNLSGDGTPLGSNPILGKRLIGRWLFTNRETRQMRRLNSVIWTAYDTESKQSLIGFGAVVPKPLSLRLKSRGFELVPL